MTDTLCKGYTPRELARLLRVRPARIRSWIRAGELPAINTGTTNRPRLVVLPHHLLEWEERRRAETEPPPKPKRRRRLPVRDYYPD